ncbi:MAG: phosphodiester glycosidase family protein [Anaerolineaceae bacterium]|nr:phosphodiester glycosidase family protein [Anaerolineaceae bacterium]
MKRKGIFRLSNLLKLVGFLGGFLILFVAGFTVMLQVSPSTGAYGAEYLRQVLGERPVAVIETVMFQAQDVLKKTEVNLGLAKPNNPWQISASNDAKVSQEPGVKAIPTSTPRTITAPVIPNTTGNVNQVQPAAPTAWMPSAVRPLGTLPGVGTWTPYITDSNGQVLAYRTFLQPDPTRSYAVTAVVAFNLKAVQLHYEVGFGEPYAPGVKKFSNGNIPVEDRLPNVLLAAFNGGFKFEHGAFGSIQNGQVSVPPRNGFGTVAIYQDGHIQIGELGADLNLSPNIVALRQNGPLVIQYGQITQQVNNPAYWGYTISYGTVTWRSGIAIDKPGDTLYYFAGPYLSIDTLARAMQAVNSWNAMQLDINNFWVNFEMFTSANQNLIPQPLFPKEMNSNIGRFLSPYVRDYFYVTAVSP